MVGQNDNHVLTVCVDDANRLVLFRAHGLFVTFGKNRHTRLITFTTKPSSDYSGATP
jgi:hypothetical protein